jgi:Reverse transcriptase (RNA-dependent DNA polymerase)
MRSLPHTTRLTRTLQEMQETHQRCLHDDERASATESALSTNSQDLSDLVFLAGDNPRTYKEVKRVYDADQWDESYDDEMNTIRKHKVWTLVPCSSVPAGRKIISSRTHFLCKRNENNEVVRQKVCVVAKGYSQIAGLDYTDTYAPVARMESVRALLHIATSLDWEIRQLDVMTAFLYGNLTEEIYMEQPEGRRVPGKDDWVCRMNKSLYGLKQGGRCWYTCLNDEMTKIGFSRLTEDHSVYRHKTNLGECLLAVHVDDMAVTASSKRILDDLIADL